MNLGGIGCEDVEWIELAQDHVLWWGGRDVELPTRLGCKVYSGSLGSYPLGTLLT